MSQNPLSVLIFSFDGTVYPKVSVGRPDSARAGTVELGTLTQDLSRRESIEAFFERANRLIVSFAEREGLARVELELGKRI